MYKQKRNPFTANCCETSYVNASVVKVDMDNGVLGKANDDGTIHINKDVTDPKKVQDIVEHEKIHIDQMQRGDLAYDDNNVYWKGKRYSRSSMKEGDKNLPWEKEAYEKSNSSPLNNLGDPFKKKKHSDIPRVKKPKNKYKPKSRNVSSTLQQQQNQIPKIQQTVNNNTTKTVSSKPKMLPTKVVSPPPPEDFITDKSYNYDPVTGRRTYSGATNMGNVLRGEEGFGEQGQQITTQNYYNNNLTRVSYDSKNTNLDALTNVLWKQYENTGQYNNKYDFRKDLKRDIAEFRENRDVSARMYDFTDDLKPIAPGSKIKSWKDDQGQEYQVKWQDAKDDKPGQYVYSTVDSSKGVFSEFFSLNDPRVQKDLTTAVSNQRIKNYEDKWKNSKENQDFVNKWGGSRIGEDGVGVNFNPNMQNWYTSNQTEGNRFEGRLFQQDVNEESLSDAVGPYRYNPYNDRDVLTGRYKQYE